MVDVAVPRLSVWLVGGQPLIHVDKPQYNGAKRFEKRAFDVGFSLLVLIAAAPVMLVAALAIKLTSRGPIFYLSERVGLDGVKFRMVKFRSMVVDADNKLAEIAHLNECDGVLFKIRCDPRVTAVGRFLRRYSIDELPQILQCAARSHERGRSLPAHTQRGRCLRPQTPAVGCSFGPVLLGYGRSAVVPICPGRIRFDWICRTSRTGQ